MLINTYQKLRKYCSNALATISLLIKKKIAISRLKIEHKYFLFQQRLQKHHSTIQRFVFALFMAGTFVALAPFMEAITNYFNAKENIDTLNDVIIAIGAALISGTIVIFSFLIFVMEINIERMPYGLFHKFSSDKKLPSFFLLAFIFAILITCTALNKNASFVSLQLWLVCWLTF
ncbi:MAG: hypothetical protein ACK53X_08520, partial [Holosporales bacterium]